jgi:beta-1,2-mannobiose phosphorylase / 1,2-beta-oligomannan phosphorylase
MESQNLKQSLMKIKEMFSSFTHKTANNNSGKTAPQKTPPAAKKLAVKKSPLKSQKISKQATTKTVTIITPNKKKLIAKKLTAKKIKITKKVSSLTKPKLVKKGGEATLLKKTSKSVAIKNRAILAKAKPKNLIKKTGVKNILNKKERKTPKILKKKLKLVPALTPKKKAPRVYVLQKSPQNPIIKPNGKNSWESWQTFNPAVLYLDDQVHFLYRAIGDGGVSVLGYAASPDGIKVTKRQNKPAYVLKEEFFDELRKGGKAKFFTYASGGSAAGCEDPRLTEIDGRVYMIHTTFSNWLYLRMTLSSISKDDFVNRRWHKWTHPVFISAPGEVHKNWVMFPEKIKGKYVILNSISPKLSVSYLDSLKFDGKTFIKSYYKPAPIANGWEEYRRGVGPTPIKTKAGWLLFYHAVEKHESHKYKIGAMLLDKNNPEKILYSAKEPVLEPDMIYENQGFKPGIVYSCGAVVINGQLFIYYGGADTVICVATANLNEFVNSLVAGEKPKLAKTTLLKNKN